MWKLLDSFYHGVGCDSPKQYYGSTHLRLEFKEDTLNLLAFFTRPGAGTTGIDKYCR